MGGADVPSRKRAASLQSALERFRCHECTRTPVCNDLWVGNEVAVENVVNLSERERHWTELMEQSLQGDACAYRRLLVLLTAGLRNVVRGRARAAGLDAEDVVQEVLLALHVKRSTWMPGTPVAPWVAAIARNKIVDALRRRGQRIEVPIESVMEQLWSNASGGEGEAYDLERVLGRLNPRQRDVVRAVSLEGRSAREVAASLEMSEGAVRVTLHRSLRSLAAIFRAVPNED
jgi:RNA polymerase sigma-70 factor (ECF subfamily)